MLCLNGNGYQVETKFDLNLMPSRNEICQNWKKSFHSDTQSGPVKWQKPFSERGDGCSANKMPF